MKILLITTKASIGGAQVFVLNLARIWQERGFEVAVVAGAGDFLPRELESAGIKFYNFFSLKRDNSLLSGWRFIIALRRFLKHHPFDVVHFNSSNALFGVISLWGLRPKPRSIFTVHGLSVLDHNYQVSAGRRWLYHYFFKFFLRLVDRVVFVSRFNKEVALADGLIKQGEVIGNGLDEEAIGFLSRSEAQDFLRRKTGLDLDHVYLVGSIGRLSYAKNYDWLIRVWPKILDANKAVRLVIFGSGEEEKTLRRLIESMNLIGRVFIISSDKAARYLKAFDLFLLPSRYEGFPLTLVEAMLAGLPVLASRVGGNAEILERPEALYNFNDQAEFLERFFKLSDDPALRRDLAEFNYRTAAKFSLSAMADRYQDIYSSL